MIKIYKYFAYFSLLPRTLFRKNVAGTTPPVGNFVQRGTIVSIVTEYWALISPDCYKYCINFSALLALRGSSNIARLSKSTE